MVIVLINELTSLLLEIRYLAFVVSVIISQSMFVFKKKQFEKVQIAELDF